MRGGRENSQLLANKLPSQKRCKIGPRLLLIINRKSHTRFWLVPKSSDKVRCYFYRHCRNSVDYFVTLVLRYAISKYQLSKVVFNAQPAQTRPAKHYKKTSSFEEHNKQFADIRSVHRQLSRMHLITSWSFYLSILSIGHCGRLSQITCSA